MKIGVIGAGTMGAGIAQVFAATPGYQVVLCDISASLAENGKAKIAKSLEKLVAKGKMEQTIMQNLLDNISTGTIEDAAECGLVIEAVLENMQVKAELFKQLAGICAQDTLFATNTSSLSITALSKEVGVPVVGMHFFNPAPVMKLVEVVAGLNTPQQTTDTIFTIAEQIGKTPIQVQEGAGFVVNRVLVPMINEAVGILAEGLASAADIDTAMKLGANHPMGPLALADLIGLDVCLAIMEVLQSEMGEPKYRPHPLLKKMVRGGQLGRKTKQGFFSYE